MAEHKLLGIILAVGLVIVAGIFAFIDNDEEAASDGAIGTTVAVAPPDTAADTTSAIDMGDNAAPLPADSPLAGKILVSKRPVEVLAAPSASASAMYGFPAGRPFRALSREGEFIRIQDVRSGASGWIEEAALAPAPTKPPAAAPASGNRSTAKATQQRKRTSSQNDPIARAAEPPKRRGIFGGDGILGGLFGGR